MLENWDGKVIDMLAEVGTSYWFQLVGEAELSMDR